VALSTSSVILQIAVGHVVQSLCEKSNVGTAARTLREHLLHSKDATLKGGATKTLVSRVVITDSEAATQKKSSIVRQALQTRGFPAHRRGDPRL